MPNATMVKFGYPRTSVADTAQWSIQLRPQQPTLGSLVLVCKGEAQAFSDIGAEAFADLQHAIAGIERMLGAFVAYQRINYLMLMMVDPHVHFHVVPRYEEPRDHEGRTYTDAGWPGPPALGQAVTPDEATTERIRDRLSTLWNAS